LLDAGRPPPLAPKSKPGLAFDFGDDEEEEEEEKQETAVEPKLSLNKTGKISFGKGFMSSDEIDAQEPSAKEERKFNQTQQFPSLGKMKKQFGTLKGTKSFKAMPKVGLALSIDEPLEKPASKQVAFREAEDIKMKRSMPTGGDDEGTGSE